MVDDWFIRELDRCQSFSLEYILLTEDEKAFQEYLDTPFDHHFSGTVIPLRTAFLDPRDIGLIRAAFLAGRASMKNQVDRQIMNALLPGVFKN